MVQAAERTVTDERTVLFVCLHGAGMSRLAAAYFLSAAPADWHAVSAGVEPADTLSPTAEALLSGTAAAQFLDHAPPRGINAVDKPWRLIALRNPSIQYELASDETWDLTSSAGAPLRDEIRSRVDGLVRSIAREEREPS